MVLRLGLRVRGIGSVRTLGARHQTHLPQGQGQGYSEAASRNTSRSFSSNRPPAIRLANPRRPRALPNRILHHPLRSQPSSTTQIRTMGATIHPQKVDAPLTLSATFLVLTVNWDAPDAVATVRSTLASLDDVAKNVAIRDLTGANLACTAGIGSDAWDKLVPADVAGRPAELHPFREVRGAKHTAVSTPGDILLHIRSDRRDVCFELERQLVARLGAAAAVADETVGFRYFDARDLLGFVDGTANPVGRDVPPAVLLAQTDCEPAGAGPGAAVRAAALAGGSYVVVQKYLHDMAGWRSLSTQQQEAIIGRTKLDNEELPDAAAGAQSSHKTLATVEDEATGEEMSILRDNMPFGSPASGEFGTYFVGYARRLWVVEAMLRRMFVGEPEGLHDRILDYSRAVTGTVFFAPPASLLRSLGDE